MLHVICEHKKMYLSQLHDRRETGRLERGTDGMEADQETALIHGVRWISLLEITAQSSRNVVVAR